MLWVPSSKKNRHLSSNKYIFGKRLGVEREGNSMGHESNFPRQHGAVYGRRRWVKLKFRDGTCTLETEASRFRWHHSRSSSILPAGITVDGSKIMTTFDVAIITWQRKSIMTRLWLRGSSTLTRWPVIVRRIRIHFGILHRSGHVRKLSFSVVRQ